MRLQITLAIITLLFATLWALAPAQTLYVSGTLEVSVCACWWTFWQIHRPDGRLCVYLGPLRVVRYE